MPDPVVHFEIISAEAPSLHRFYGSVFGWKIAADNPFGYGMVDTRNPGRGINGGIGTPVPGATGHFTVYVQVPNIDAALSRVITEGGRIALSKTTVPNGPTMAQFFDPAGHLVGLIEGSGDSEAARRARAAAVSARPATPAGQPRPASTTHHAGPKAAAAAKPQPNAKAKAKAKPKAAAKAKPKVKAKPVAKKAKAPAKPKSKAKAKGKGRARR
jgi:predicted enzyme related to lactoylglutathione lyase